MRQWSVRQARVEVVVRVVIVDDTEDLRRLLGMVLSGDGHEVVGEAADGVEAVEMAERNRPDAVVLDYHMPVMNGLEALPRILAACPAAKVVLFTSGISGVIHETAMALGAAAVIEKSTGIDAILASLRS